MTTYNEEQKQPKVFYEKLYAEGEWDSEPYSPNLSLIHI